MYKITNRQDSKRPDFEFIRSAADAFLGDTVIPDIPPANYIWDEASQAMRAPTAAEQLAALKIAKRRELLLAFKAEYALVWVIDGIEVEEQKDAILAKSAANRTANEANLVNQAGTLITKIKSRFADVNNATTEAQVQGITW